MTVRSLRALLALVAVAGCRTEEVIGIDVVGPACDCDSHFPACVGASWTYWVRNAQTSAISEKTFSIVDWKDPEMGAYGLTGFRAFRQLRVTDADSKDSWLVKSADGLRFTWLFDEWFDPNGRPTRLSFYVPGKLRMDETPEHVIPGATWHEEYTEHVIERSMPPAVELTIAHQVDWTTDEPYETNDFTDTLCQHKIDMKEGEAVPIDAKYCFARGIGKHYELTVLVGEEKLKSWTVPGCSEGQVEPW